MDSKDLLVHSSDEIPTLPSRAMHQGGSCNFTASNLGKNIDTDDHISQLPDAILSHILTFLNVEEALRTRLLSHRWRYIPLPVSKLVFDPTIITGLYGQSVNYSIQSLKYKFVDRVDHILNTITVQKPLTLKICFPLGQEVAPHINDWIRLAVRMESEAIILDLNHRNYSEYSYIHGNNFEPYNFPCHILLSYGKSYLKYLSLCECIFKPPLEVANRLNSLKSLRLDNVPIEASDLENILSGCLNLEWLGLVNCELLSTLRICGQDLRLKFLIVSTLSGMEKIELSVPDLEMFEYEGTIPEYSFSRLHQLKKIVLVIYKTTHRGLNQMLVELSGNVPNLQTLSLTCHSNKDLSYAYVNDHTPTFDNLTHLVLTIERGFGWNLFIYMLCKSPQLEDLVIKKGYSYTPSLYDLPSWIHARLVPACVSSCLKKVYLEIFNGNDCELEFAEYILKNASVLEAMTIKITISLGASKRTIVNQIKEFPRSSEACHVLIL